MREMKGNMVYHFQLSGDNVVCWNGNDGWTVIATVLEKRPCRQLLRYAQMAEDVEYLMDGLIADTSGIAPATCPEIESIKGGLKGSEKCQ